jgi:uncharacterized membrane protein
MYLIVIIVGIVGYIHLNNKISELEKLIKGGTAVQPQPTAQPMAQSAAVTPTPVAQDVAVPQNIQVPAFQYEPQTQAMPQPMPARVSQESSEEAGGRWLGKIGVAAVFIGVAFFLKYAFDNNLIGVVGRVMIGILIGAMLIIVGQYLRSQYQKYSDILIGGGIGILYLTTFSSFAFYRLIDLPVAFFFVALITLLAMIMSFVDDSPTIAIIGTLGGFVTPMMLSIDKENVFSLFTYILILDIGVLAVSIKKKWVSLQYLAFFGTSLTVLIWATVFYTNRWLGASFAFLTMYFIVFLATTFVRHLLNKEKATGADTTFVTLNALGYFGMSYALLNGEYEQLMGMFALMLALVYVALAWFSYEMNPEDDAMNFFLPGLAFVFVTLAIPIQFSGSWITLAWLVEGLVLFVLAFAVKKHQYQAFGLIAYSIGLIKLYADYALLRDFSNYTPFFNERFFYFVIAIAIAYAICFLYAKNPTEKVMGSSSDSLMAVFLVIANLLTIYIATTEITTIYTLKIAAEQARDGVVSYNSISSLKNQSNTVVSIIWTLYAVLLIGVGFVARSKVLRIFGLIFFFVTAFKIFIDVWSLGELYRIISSIIFGVVALIASFVYAKYKHRINDMMINN